MKVVQGVVISDKMNKAAVVLIERSYRHPVYGKILRRKKKIHASNEIGTKAGQMVKLSETRPISKTIAFKISEIVGEKKNEEEPPTPAPGGIRRAKVK